MSFLLQGHSLLRNNAFAAARTILDASLRRSTLLHQAGDADKRPRAARALGMARRVQGQGLVSVAAVSVWRPAGDNRCAILAVHAMYTAVQRCAHRIVELCAAPGSAMLLAEVSRAACNRKQHLAAA